MEEHTLRQKLERILKLQNDSIKSKLSSPPALPPRPRPRPLPNPRIRKSSIKLPDDDMLNTINLTQNHHQHQNSSSSSMLRITPEIIDDQNQNRKTKRGDTTTTNRHSNFINEIQQKQNQEKEEALTFDFLDPKPTSTSSSQKSANPTKKLPLKITIDEHSTSSGSLIQNIMERRDQYLLNDAFGLESLFEGEGAVAGPPEELKDQVIPDIVDLQGSQEEPVEDRVVHILDRDIDDLQVQTAALGLVDEASIELLNEYDLSQQLEISEIIRQQRQSDQGEAQRAGIMDIKLGSRIVWFSSETDEPEAGTCRSLGQFDDGYLAGIEFENRIGYSNGCYTDGVRYFTCESNHGRFIPLDQLLLYEDFYGEPRRPAGLEPVVKVKKRINYRCSIGSVNAIICVICQDSLIMPTPQDPATEKETIATKCGHLFHNSCIEEWFSTRTSEKDKLCPTCSRKVNVPADVIRIYPAQAN